MVTTTNHHTDASPGSGSPAGSNYAGQNNSIALPHLHDSEGVFDLEMSNTQHDSTHGGISYPLQHSPAQEYQDDRNPVLPVQQASSQIITTWDQSTTEGDDGAATSKKPPLTGIEACIDRIIRTPTLIRDSSGRPDTLIYIGRLCLQNRHREDQMQEYYCNQPILVERSKLEALHSPYFNKCFTGAYQTRKWKALSAQIALHLLPPGIKYVINMTPEIEGMEAVQSIQDLSCPLGILQWKKSYDRWHTNKSSVSGTDENDMKIEPGATAMEYSRVRHVKSIERFMTALQGNNPGFDSAPKLYTAVMVSKPWNIQGPHPLMDYVAAWLWESEGNSNFVEAFPEVVLKIADVLKCAPLCQDAFSVLVGETALYSTLTHDNEPGKTTYGRIHGDIEEDWLSRIQHARNSFIDRVNDVFDSLAGEHMDWVASLPAIIRIRRVARLYGTELETDRSVNFLKRFIRGAIYKLLCNDYKYMTRPQDQTSTSGDDLYPRNTGDKVWNTLRAPERIFTVRFWRIMVYCYLTKDDTEFATNQTMIRTEFIEGGTSAICSEYANGPLMECIGLSRLIAMAPMGGQVVKHYSTHPLSMESPRISSTQFRATSTTSTDKPFQTFSSLRQWNATASTVLSPHNQHIQGSVQPNQMTPLSEPLGQTSLGPSFTTCPHPSCLRNLFLVSMSRFCFACRRSYCSDHIHSSQHDCWPYEFETTGSRQERQSTSSPDTEPDANKDTTWDAAWGTEHNQVSNSRLHQSVSKHQVQLSLVQEILHSAVLHIRSVARRMLAGTSGGNLGTFENSNRIGYTLCSLTEDETKFLPLWAEGFDDGTGGVFGEHIPSANEDDLAFRSGGRHLATRSEGSDYSFVSGTVDSTVNTSTIAHDGYRDTLPRGRVVAMDEVDSSSEGGWSYIQETVEDNKGKSRVQEVSEVATTLGALEDASVVDLGIGPDPANAFDHEDLEILSSAGESSPGTILGADDEELEDSFDEYDGTEDDDDDLEMIFDDELSKPDTSKQTVDAQASKVITTPFTSNALSAATKNEQNSMAGVSYVYKNELDYDLMTRP